MITEGAHQLVGAHIIEGAVKRLCKVRCAQRLSLQQVTIAAKPLFWGLGLASNVNSEIYLRQLLLGLRLDVRLY